MTQNGKFFQGRQSNIMEKVGGYQTPLEPTQMSSTDVINIDKSSLDSKSKEIPFMNNKI